MNPAKAAADLLDERESAVVMKCAPKTMRNDRALGKGPPYIRYRGRIYYRRATLEAYLAELEKEGAARLAARREAHSLTSSLTRTRRNQRFREIAAEFQTNRRRSPTDQRSAGRSRASR